MLLLKSKQSPLKEQHIQFVIFGAATAEYLSSKVSVYKQTRLQLELVPFKSAKYITLT